MEGIADDLRGQGKSLDSLRMSSRPPPPSALAPGKGRGYEDLGRTQFKTNSRDPQPKKRVTTTYGTTLSTKRKQRTGILEDEDELDMFSTENSSPPSSPPPRLSKLNGASKSEDRKGDGIIMDGQFHTYHPDFQPKKFPSFKKNKPKDTADNLQSSSQPSVDPQDASTPKPRPKPRAAYKNPGRSIADTIAGSSKDTRADTIHSSRVSNTKAHGSTPLRDKSPNFPNSQDRPRPKPRRAYARKELEDFPMPSPPSKSTPPVSAKGKKIATSPAGDLHPVGDTRVQSTAKGKEKEKEKEKGLPDSFPAPSPLSSRKLSKATTGTFSIVPPSSSPIKCKCKGKGKLRGRVIDFSFDSADTEMDELEMSADDELETRGAPRPFPMSTQMLKSIGSSQDLDVGGAGVKRLSERSEGGSERDRKKRKERDDDAGLAVFDLDVDMSHMDDDLLFIDPSVDPATLCPYCDEPLPSAPTPHLRALLASIRRKSYRDSRPSNPLGLKAPLSTFVAVCQRHRFETVQLPRAQAMGWPVDIEWDKLRERVEGMKRWLKMLVEDGGNDPGTEDDAEEDERSGPRARSVFWKEVIKEVKKKGSRAVVGVRGQFASFESTQPGYYGELGSVIIHQTLYNLFPPSSFDPLLIAPLTSTEFIQRILVPEVAVALIMEDMDIDKANALKTLRESVQYGVAMFPDAGNADGGGDGDEMGMGVGAGDEIVRERARMRRRELEEEERIEETLEKEKRKLEDGEREGSGNESKSDQKAEGRWKRKTKDNHDDNHNRDVSEASDTGQREGKRRILRKKSPEAEESDGLATDASMASSIRRSKRIAIQDTKSSRSRRPLKADIDISRSADEVESSDTASGTELCSQSTRRRKQKENRKKESADAENIEELGTPRLHSTKTGISVHGGHTETDGEVTPRPQKPQQDHGRPLASSGHSASSLSSTQPLVIARERKWKRTEAESAGHWVSNMRSSVPEEEHDTSDSSVEISRIHTAKFSRTPGYSWLLSDGSNSPSPS